VGLDALVDRDAALLDGQALALLARGDLQVVGRAAQDPYERLPVGGRGATEPPSRSR
jgi:hypothetical protein